MKLLLIALLTVCLLGCDGVGTGGGGPSPEDTRIIALIAVIDAAVEVEQSGPQLPDSFADQGRMQTAGDVPTMVEQLEASQPETPKVVQETPKASIETPKVAACACSPACTCGCQSGQPCRCGGGPMASAQALPVIDFYTAAWCVNCPGPKAVLEQSTEFKLNPIDTDQVNEPAFVTRLPTYAWRGADGRGHWLSGVTTDELIRQWRATQQVSRVPMQAAPPQYAAPQVQTRRGLFGWRR